MHFRGERTSGTQRTEDSVGLSKANLRKAWLNLSGVATPEGIHPTGRHVSILRTKVTGGVMALGGIAAGYYFILLPLVQAKKTGVLHQGPFGLVMPIVLFYAGAMTLATDVRDAAMWEADTQNRLRWTRRGNLFRYGMWGFALANVLIWCLYVRSIGLSPIESILSSLRR